MYIYVYMYSGLVRATVLFAVYARCDAKPLLVCIICIRNVHVRGIYTHTRSLHCVLYMYRYVIYMHTHAHLFALPLCESRET